MTQPRRHDTTRHDTTRNTHNKPNTQNKPKRNQQKKTKTNTPKPKQTNERTKRATTRRFVRTGCSLLGWWPEAQTQPVAMAGEDDGVDGGASRTKVEAVPQVAAQLVESVSSHRSSGRACATDRRGAGGGRDSQGSCAAHDFARSCSKDRIHQQKLLEAQLGDSSSFPELTRDPKLGEEVSSLYWLRITRFTGLAFAIGEPSFRQPQCAL